MRDLRNSKLIYLKAMLLLCIGMISCVLILMQLPTVEVAVLLTLAIWAFARCYYFAFYVIERYFDPTFKFAGIISFVNYVLRNR